MRSYIRRRHSCLRHISALLSLVLLIFLAYALGLNRAEPPEGMHTAPPERITRRIPLAAYRFFAIQLGAFDNEPDARALSEGLVPRGAAGYVLTDTRSRAICAAYTARDAAEKVRHNLAAQGIDAYVYEVSAPRVELRIAAEPELIAELESACAVLPQAAEALANIALLIDRGDVLPADALSGISAIAAGASERLAKLQALLGEREHTLTRGLKSELNAVCDACAMLLKYPIKPAIAFSGKVKYNVIDLMQRHVQFMRLLTQPAAPA